MEPFHKANKKRLKMGEVFEAMKQKGVEDTSRLPQRGGGDTYKGSPQQRRRKEEISGGDMYFGGGVKAEGSIREKNPIRWEEEKFTEKET